MRLTKRDPKTERLAYSRSEAAALFGVHPTTISRWLGRGLLRAINIPGGDRMIDAASLQRLIQNEAKTKRAR